MSNFVFDKMRSIVKDEDVLVYLVLEKDISKLKELVHKRGWKLSTRVLYAMKEQSLDSEIDSILYKTPYFDGLKEYFISRYGADNLAQKIVDKKIYGLYDELSDKMLLDNKVFIELVARKRWSLLPQNYLLKVWDNLYESLQHPIKPYYFNGKIRSLTGRMVDIRDYLACYWMELKRYDLLYMQKYFSVLLSDEEGWRYVAFKGNNALMITYLSPAYSHMITHECRKYWQSELDKAKLTNVEQRKYANVRNKHL